ncbi:hypothetical protein ABPG74_018439 [Tetrahymena malaccensis]
MNFFQSKINLILANKFILNKGLCYKYSCFNHSFPKFTFCSYKSSQSKIEDILKQINSYDSKQIMEEYRNYSQTTSNFTRFMEISNQFLKQMKGREDKQKALEICDLVVQKCLTKFTENNENPYMFFKGQQALLNYKLNKNDESTKIAESLYKDFNSQLNKLKTYYLILSAKYLLEVMVQIKNIEISKKLLNDIQILLAEDNWQTLSTQQIFDIYYIHFGIYYLDENYQEAANWGWKSYQQLQKLNSPNFRPDYILIGLYICYKKLNQIDQSEEVLVEIQKYQKFSRDYLDQLEQSYIQPFEFDKQEEKEKMFQQIQHNNRNESQTHNKSESKQSMNSQNEAQSNLKDEDKGNYFIQNKLFKEGIAYYKNQLQKLDAQKDTLKYVFIQDRIAYLYSECQDFQKAINLCLDSHTMLVKLYDNQLASNFETFQNLSYIKTIYEKNNEIENAIQWGQKWHDYCKKYKLFDKQSEVIESNMLSHAAVLSKAGKINQALLYCQNIIQYLQKFPNQKEMLKFGLNQLLYSLSQQVHNTQGQKEAAIALCELSRNIMSQDKEYRSYFFMMLKESINLSLVLDDKKNFMKYGSEYLKIREEYDNKEEDIESAVQIMFDVGQQLVQDNLYSQAIEVLIKAISISKRAPIDQNQIQINLLLTTLYILQNKIEEAELYLQQARYLYDTYYASSSNQQKLEIDIVKISAIIQYHKGNNVSCLDLIEKYFEMLSNQQDNDIYEDIIIILSNLSDIKDYQNRVKQIQTKYNLNLE